MINTLINASGRVSAYIILALYVLAMVGIAYYSRSKKGSGTDDFLLAGRKMGGWMSAFAYGTTYFSAVIFIGYAGKLGWAFGMATLWIGLGNALIGSFLAWKLLALRTRTMTHSLNAKTMPEFFEARYGDKKIKMVSCIIIFIFLIPYSASVYQGLGYLFELIFGIDFIWVILIMAVLTSLYLVAGGYLATAITDFVQGIIMIIGVLAMVFIILDKVDWGNGISQAVELSGGLIANTSMDKGFINSPFVIVTALMILTSLGMWGLPQSVHKFYAVKDKSAAKKATIISTAFAAIIGLGAYFFGTFGKLVLGTLPEGGVDYIIPNLLMQVVPSVLLGIIAVLVLSASMSSLASMTLSSSSAISVDMYKGYINPNADDKKVTSLTRILCLVFVALSAIFAINQVDIIITLMSLSWGTLAGCFIGPYVWGLFSKKITRAAAWTSIIGGLVWTFTWILILGAIYPKAGFDGFTAVLKGGLGYTPQIGASAMILSLIITPIVSKFTTPPSSEITDLAFQNIECK